MKILRECDRYDVGIKFDKNYYEEWKNSGNMPENLEKNIVFDDEMDNNKFWFNLDFGTNKVINYFFFIFYLNLLKIFFL